jgi:hypothetical protein
MRAVTVLLTLLVAIPGALASATFVDLDKPGALGRLQRDNPEHYRAVRGIVANVVKQPEASVPEWMRVTYKADDVLYPPILLTSNPPKRDLRFRLDDVTYRTLVTLPYVPTVAEPAFDKARPR